MATITTDLICNLNQPVAATFLHGNLFSQDNAGNTINVHVMDNGEPATIGGTVSANVIRADGNTVAVSGAIDGNKAYVILPQACYAVPGRVEIIIKLTQSTTITTIAAIVANVYRSTTDTVVDPGTIIPSIQALIEEIEDAVDSIPVDYSGLLATIAADYSSSKTYPVVGMYAWQGGVLKRNIVPITTAETYTAAHWTNAVIGDDLSALKSAIDYTVFATTYHDGYIGGDGTAVTNTTDYKYCDYVKLPFPSGSIIRTNVSMLSSRGLAFYDEYKNFISVINGNNCSGYGYSANATPQEIKVPLPAKAAYIRLTIRSAYVTNANDFYVNGVNYGDIVSRLETVEELIKTNPTLTWSNAYVHTNGSIVANNDWRLSNTIKLSKGQNIKFTANGNGVIVSILSKWSNSGEFKGSIVTSTGNVYQDVDYTATDITEYVRISYAASKIAPIPIITQLTTSEVIDLVPFIVGGDNYISVGTGKDFTNLVDAIESITDSSEQNRYIIQLYPGTYNTVVTEDIDNEYVGLIIPDWVSIIGIGNRDEIIINGVLPSGYESYANNISTINFMANGRIENVTVTAENLRYCNHDDNIIFVDCKHEYIRCRFIMKAVSQGVSTAGSCVGIGAQKNKEIIFNNCTFENANTGNSRACIIAHDYNGSVGLRMELNDCKMTGGQYNIRIGNNVVSNPLQGFVVLNGNIFNKPLRVEASGSVTENSFNFRGFGNKDLTLSLGGNLTDISDDYDIIT